MLRYKDKNGDYTNIKSIKGLISDFRNPSGEKSQVNPSNTLEKIFGADDFFLI
jgi:hypothetical protein